MQISATSVKSDDVRVILDRQEDGVGVLAELTLRTIELPFRNPNARGTAVEVRWSENPKEAIAVTAEYADLLVTMLKTFAGHTCNNPKALTLTEAAIIVLGNAESEPASDPEATAPSPKEPTRSDFLQGWYPKEGEPAYAVADLDSGQFVQIADLRPSKVEADSPRLEDVTMCGRLGELIAPSARFTKFGAREFIRLFEKQLDLDLAPHRL